MFWPITVNCGLQYEGEEYCKKLRYILGLTGRHLSVRFVIDNLQQPITVTRLCNVFECTAVRRRVMDTTLKPNFESPCTTVDRLE